MRRCPPAVKPARSTTIWTFLDSSELANFVLLPNLAKFKQHFLQLCKSYKMFGVVFPNRSFPMDISSFTQIDATHWILDMNTFVGEAYDSIREVCIFLLNGLSLPPEKALAVYIQSPGSPFLYCGAVAFGRPSAVLQLPWPDPGGQMQLTADAAPISAKIGVSVEDLASLPSLDVAAEKRIERLALKVGENLFNFMQSFCGVDGSKLVVPMDILDRWFKKFQERSKRDPEYLKGFTL
ncbi:protein OPI10 homolog [Actinidia eriantha]|uniref:protein OPI10 homolog n=1 Tax=Actinidia eriantha TaxID=165200 RepID=UPI0025876768|nr:protein OPI10 homolog [Actinidia eriantha]XP_057501695.1 protein OPI10 homolog [Actinidia eriantha]XP_057501696.1 protein OPI10 homolog [Actinidia eriantha]XP_057501697.1 protein OPI10 homolog [Actinidia eriantha]